MNKLVISTFLLIFVIFSAVFGLLSINMFITVNETIPAALPIIAFIFAIVEIALIYGIIVFIKDLITKRKKNEK